MKPDVGMNNKDEQKLELQSAQNAPPLPPSALPAAAPSTPAPAPPSSSSSHPASQQATQSESLSLVERLNTYSYGQAREVIVKEMRANQEAITRLEARIETLVAILRQAGVELPPFPTCPSVKD